MDDGLDMDLDPELDLDPGSLELEFSGELWYWRGPAPHHVLTVPPDGSARHRAISRVVTYGWGMIPVRAWTGQSTWATSLFAKDGGYVLPVKAAVRAAEGLGAGDTITVRMTSRS